MELNEYSIDELNALKDQIDKEKERRVTDNLKTVADQFINLCTLYDVTPSDVIEYASKKHRKPVAVKYRDEHGNTWTGRGRQPLWVTAYKESGGDINSLAV